MSEFFTWQSLLAIILGAFYGSVFGAIPGLTATLAVALFIPVAFFLDPIVALPAIISISAVAIYAGDVGSTVARIPGTPASAAYLEELSRLAKKKGPFYGLGLCAMSSATGGVIGTILLIGLATTMAQLAKNFSSFEYFWIAILGLTAGVFASGGSTVKAIVSLLLGVLFSTVGIDPTLGYPRFDFGSPDLLGGLNYIVAMIGLFGFSEVLEFIYRRNKTTVEVEATSDVPSVQFFRLPWIPILKKKWMVLRSSLLGVLVGFLPGAGADVGSWVSSSVEKMSAGTDVENSDEYIVIAGTSSNNAAVASAWIPALALGLPGDTITAIVLGVFLMKGITPGPLLFEQQPELIWSLYATFLLANAVMLPFFGYITARLAAYLIKIPLEILLSAIAGVCVVGAYVINNSTFDIWIMAGMGLIAFFLKRGGFPLSQVVLGMVLGPILEQNFMVSAIKSRWDLTSFFDRPIALLLMALTIVIIVIGVRLKRRRRA